MKDLQKLSTRERLARIVEASAREDFARVAALEGSAPVVRLAVPNTLALRQALERMALLHVALQLTHWSELQLVSQASWRGMRRKYRGAMVLGAHVFCAYSDAWQVFCGELGVDPAAALAAAPGAMILEMAEKASRRLLPDYGTVAKLLRNDSPEAAPITVSEIAAAMRTTFDSWAETSQ